MKGCDSLDYAVKKKSNGDVYYNWDIKRKAYENKKNNQ